MKKVVVTGGGTAGHVTPLLAVASELKHQHPHVQIRYIGNVGDSFARLAQESTNIDGTWQIIAGKFRRYHGLGKRLYIRHPSIMLKNFRDLFYFIFGFLQSFWLLLWWRPQVVFVKGGFVGLPVGLAACLLHIPIVTHDSDVVPGLTNRILSRYAKFMAVAMPTNYYQYPKERMRHTGLPIRDEYVFVSSAVKKSAREQLGIPMGAFVVAVLGGSLGAVRLNNAVVDIASQYLHEDDNWILHQTGKHQQSEVEDFYTSLPSDVRTRVKMWAFVQDMHIVSAAADVVVSRAGSSIHELSAQHKTVILVPNPVLTGAHQTKNAQALASFHAVKVISEIDLSDTENKALLDEINTLKHNPQQRTALADALSTLAVPHAAARIVAVLEEAVS